MSTFTENINSAITSLEAIKQAVITKGGSVPAGTPLSEYANKILAMPAGEYTGEKSTGWINAVLSQDNTPYYTSPTSTTIVTPNSQWSINTATNTATISTTSSPSIYWLYDGLHNIKMGSPGMSYTNNIQYEFKTQDYANYVLPACAGSYYSSISYYLYRLMPVITVPESFAIESNSKLDVLLCIETGASTTSVTYSFKYRIWTPANI